MPAPFNVNLGSGIDTKGTIDKLLEVERAPINRLQKDNEEDKYRIQAWDTLKKAISSFSKASSALYGINSPFGERKVYPSEEGFIEGEASPNTDRKSTFIKVNELATFHQIHSTPIEKNKTFSSGSFQISTSDEKVNFNFKGGTIEELLKILKEKEGGHFNSSLVKVQNDKYVLSLRSANSGKEGAFHFEDKDGVLHSVDLINKTNRREKIIFSKNKIKNLDKYGEFEILQGGEAIQLDKASIQVSEEIKNAVGLALELKLIDRNEKKEATKYKLESHSMGPSLSVQVGDIELMGDNIKRDRRVPILSAPSPDKKIFRLTYFYKKDKEAKQIKKKEIEWHIKSSQNEINKLSVDLKNLPSESIISKIHLTMQGASAIVQNMKVKKTALFTPLHEIEKAKNAQIELDGVPVERSQNKNIKDLIEGVTLKLKKTSKKPIEIRVDVDEEMLSQKTENWINNYNELLSLLRDATHNNIGVAARSAISKKYPVVLGTFSGDSAVKQLLYHVQDLIAFSYPHDAKSKAKKHFKLLPQIGISTGKPDSNWTDIQHGLLLFEKSKFRTALQESPEGIAELFASRSEKSIRYDQGVAVVSVEKTKPYTQNIRGFITIKKSSLKEQISDRNKKIEDREEDVARKRDTLRQQFGRMEGAIHRSKQLSEQLNNSLNRNRTSKK